MRSIAIFSAQNLFVLCPGCSRLQKRRVKVSWERGLRELSLGGFLNNTTYGFFLFDFPDIHGFLISNDALTASRILSFLKESLLYLLSKKLWLFPEI